MQVIRAAAAQGGSGSAGGGNGRRRLKRALVVLAAAAAVTVLIDRGVDRASGRYWSRAGAEQLLAAAARGAGGSPAAIQEDTYQTLDVFSNALALIRDHYLEPVEEETLLDGAVRGIFEALDSDSAYLDPEETALFHERADAGGAVGIGLEKRYYLHVDDVLPGSPAAEAGIERGDAIAAIDGRGTRQMRTPIGRLLLSGAPGSTVELAVRKSAAETAPTVLTLERRRIVPPPVEASEPEPGVGLVRVRRFSPETAGEVAAAVASLRESGAEALVLDLRGSRPAGNPVAADPLLGVATASVFREGVVARRAERAEEGGERVLEDLTADAADGGPAGAGLLVAALVNASTAGPGEVVAAALGPLPNGEVVGGQTAGRTGRGELIPLPDGDSILMSSSHLLGPEGDDLLGSGVAPTLTPEDLDLRGADLDEDDPELDFALRALRHRRSGEPAVEAANR